MPQISHQNIVEEQKQVILKLKQQKYGEVLTTNQFFEKL